MTTKLVNRWRIFFLSGGFLCIKNGKKFFSILLKKNRSFKFNEKYFLLKWAFAPGELKMVQEGGSRYQIYTLFMFVLFDVKKMVVFSWHCILSNK
ncbi:MAG: hypothetical protein CM15mP126_0560 [Gammaproteobacteria bacterium]|nr:MAG: hypothetical protein CM15mP126_0560 [Gammaproteobacteria bacterium]